MYSRDILESLAMGCISEELYYDLMDCIGEATDAELVKIITDSGVVI